MTSVGFAGVLLLSACASAPAVESFPALTPSGRSCVDDADGVTWVRAAPPVHQPTLDAWCASVGPPWRHTGAPVTTPSQTLIVINWNMHVGRGHLEELLTYLRAEFKKEMVQDRAGLVLLLQEVHREGAAVPASPRFPRAVPRQIRSPVSAPDIEQLAQAVGMSAVYVPSMRNGRGSVESQDRGNAILTTEALSAPTAIELPFGRQRRVAVAATIHDIRFVSVHLDTGRARAEQADALASLVVTPAGSTVVAGDLNSVEGRNDGAYKALADRMTAAACGERRTHAWPWRLELLFGGWVGRLDHIFTSLPAGQWLVRCSTVPHFFGSDHRPQVLVLRATYTPNCRR
jgi:endonuclease/exonuclease/phosphatase family metal-dependent hydrolase